LKKRKKRQQNIIAPKGNELARVKSDSQYKTIIPASPGSISTLTGSPPNTIGIDDDALKVWLNNIQMAEYYDLFNEQGFCEHMDSLQKLTNDELREMGITKMAHRIKILSKIENDTQYVSDGEGVGSLIPNGTTINMFDEEDDDDDVIYQKDHETTSNGTDCITDFGGNDVTNINNENSENEEEDDDRMYQKGGSATNGQ